MPSSRPTVTILTPVFNEERNLPQFVHAVTEVLLSRPEYDFQVVFVDDGSTDASWRSISTICVRDPRFRGIRLSRNFGAHIALTAGMKLASGDAVATLACDLQDPPEVILRFLDEWQRGARIVWGWRRKRGDCMWRVLASNFFYELTRRFAMPAGSRLATGSFLLIDHRVVECFRQFREHNRLTFALIAWTGFDQAVVEYDRQQRQHGRSGWTLGRMVKSFFDTFISFSRLPAKMMTGLGMGVLLMAIPLSLYALRGDPLRGWTSQMLMMCVFFGLQFMMMGMIGEYLHRIYEESVQRPLYFISDSTFDSEEDRRAA